MDHGCTALMHAKVLVKCCHQQVVTRCAMCVCVCGLRKSKQTLLGGERDFLVCECRRGKNKQRNFLSQRTHSKYTILVDTQCLLILECVGYTILEDTQCLLIFECVGYTILEGYTISAQYLHNFEALRANGCQK